MSERSTNATQRLLLEGLPRLFKGTSSDRWAAQDELRAKARELADRGMVDDQAIREIALYNAGKHLLDIHAADAIFDVAQKPAGGSLAAMHAQSRRVWQGTGSSIAIAGPDVVHYIHRPGIVEEWYGPAFPYVIDKLGWLAIARDIAGHHNLTNQGGYQYVTNRLHRLGRPGLPHIGPAIIERDHVSSWKPVEPRHPESIIASASGTLVEPWVDVTYERIPEYAERAIRDETAGLFDGHIENRRAGLYDTEFSEMIGKALYGGAVQDQMLGVFRADCYEGVDIN